MRGTRKQNGEGSVFQVSENKWVAKISMGIKPDGKPNIKQFSGKSEAIVKKKLKDFKKSTDFAEKHMPRSMKRVLRSSLKSISGPKPNNGS